ncbi:MAG: TetR/AcrR family transcriptional regulator [Saccharopolyspora sp.]|uniref:TetR/AcrR family transcriptional regulator n=1 Tax=Saccharopolyspora TaxID=1835 RepID=UPI0019091ADF|nr:MULTISPECIES: TetR/AcrR family transcriptional regulator [unclassified Saccharopolyspora]MBK0870011.1 TetR/AcrR family transcriptional regulator [Saccharopolyspora sp. HNM0986]MBQ6642037.1 TetR/AcrR family transcriptional regulator [Saccharopolyspora sp.]
MTERGRPRAFDREVALHKAMEVFWASGYEGTSIGDLTAAMGINAPSLYATFGSKEGLFRSATERYNTVEGRAANDALHRAATARLAVESMLRSYARSYTDPATPRGCMIVLAANVGTARNAGVREHLAGLRREVLATLRQRLERGIAEGDVRADTDTASVATFYATVLQGLSIQAKDGASLADLEGVIDHAMSAWPAAPS